MVKKLLLLFGKLQIVCCKIFNFLQFPTMKATANQQKKNEKQQPKDSHQKILYACECLHVSV